MEISSSTDSTPGRRRSEEEIKKRKLEDVDESIVDTTGDLVRNGKVVHSQGQDEETQSDPSQKKAKLACFDQVKDSDNSEAPVSTTTEISHFSTLEGFEIKKVLSNNPEFKRVVLEASYQDQSAVVILEKKPFGENSLIHLLSKESTLNLILKNDIYGSYDCSPIEKEAVIKTTIVYPATSKHIEKYVYSPFCLVEETPELYEKVVLPYLQSSSFSIDWVYNILEHKKETERIIFEDTDKETGFILLPDLKWDGVQLENLYLSAIVHSHGIKSLRDLNSNHLHLLENILVSGSRSIEGKYGLKRSQLRVYIHYQPSYYHLHVHFTSLQFNAAGISVEKSHLLASVISNIKLNSSYYQEAILPFTVKEKGPLYEKVMNETRRNCSLDILVSRIMATNFEDTKETFVKSNVGSDCQLAIAESTVNEDVNILAEHFPNLSIVNLYIKSKTLASVNKPISILQDNTILSIQTGLSFTLKNITFENPGKNDEFNRLPMSTSEDIFHYRLIARPVLSSTGSSRNEVIQNCQINVERNFANIFSKKKNEIILEENEMYTIKCRTCNYSIGSNISFEKIRELPDSNWMEKSDEWFCHPPGPKCGVGGCKNISPKSSTASEEDKDDTLTKITNNLENVNLSRQNSEPIQTRRTIFDVLQNPGKSACLFGPCYWVVNAKNTKVKLSSNKSTDRKSCYCPNCDNEIGLILADDVIEIWDFGVIWQKVDNNFVDKKVNLEMLFLSNFRKIIFASLCEASFNLTCKIMVKSSESGDSIFLWSIDNNLPIYVSTITSTKLNDEKLHTSAATELCPRNAIKFLYYTTVGGKSSLENDFEKNMCSEYDVELIIPQIVFNIGLKELTATSAMYLSKPGSFKCCYLFLD